MPQGSDGPELSSKAWRLWTKMGGIRLIEAYLIAGHLVGHANAEASRAF